MPPGWLANTTMTNNALNVSSKANGGKIWNPYLKVAKPAVKSSSAKTIPPAPALPQRRFSLWTLVTIEAVLLLSLTISMGPTFKAWNRITNPAAHYISNGNFYSANINDTGSIISYAISTLLIIITAAVGGLIVKKIYNNYILDVVLKTTGYILGSILLIGLIFMPLKHITNLLDQDSYNNWIKKEVGVSEIIYLKNGFIQGKDGIYEVTTEKENGYYKYTVKKVEL